METNASVQENLRATEHAVARIALIEDQSASKTDSLLLTDQRIIYNGAALFTWDDVRRCHWIHRDQAEAAKLKRTHFHRVIIELHDGNEVILDRLGQAVFPLLKFLWWIRGHA